MISFKDYVKDSINEDTVQKKTTLINLILSSYIPLTSTMIDRLGIGENNYKAFHALRLKNLSGLRESGNSKKAFSTFTKNLDSIVKMFDSYPYEFVAVVQGTALLKAGSDIYTKVSEDSRRWFKIGGVQGAQNQAQAKIIEKIQRSVYQNLGSLITSEVDLTKYKSLTYKDKGKLRNIIKRLDTDKRNMFYTKYFNLVEGMLENKQNQSTIFNYLKSEYTDKHDEIVMNRFKVLGVYSIQNGMFSDDKGAAEDIVKNLGYRYLGHIKKEKFNKVDVKNYGKI